MARKRMIDPDFWSDEKLGELTRDERLLFMGLISNSDDEGRGRANPKLLKSNVFPYDEDINSKNVKEMLDNLSNTKMVIFYVVDGQEFYWLPNFKKHQSINRPQPSKIPEYKPCLEHSLNSTGIFSECSGNSMELFTPNRREKKLKEEKLKEEEEKGEKESSTSAPVEKVYQENIGLITPIISQSISHWLDDGIEEALINRYIEVSVKRNKKSWGYVESMIKGNLNVHVKTLEQYEAMCIENEKNKPVSTQQKPTYANFDQREYTDDEYEKFYANLNK